MTLCLIDFMQERNSTLNIQRNQHRNYKALTVMQDNTLELSRCSRFRAIDGRLHDALEHKGRGLASGTEHAILSCCSSSNFCFSYTLVDAICSCDVVHVYVQNTFPDFMNHAPEVNLSQLFHYTAKSCAKWKESEESESTNIELTRSVSMLTTQPDSESSNDSD